VSQVNKNQPELHESSRIDWVIREDWAMRGNLRWRVVGHQTIDRIKFGVKGQKM
jgi:hypothetical protein